MRWLIGFVFYRTAFGLLSVLLPLYVTQTLSGGNLTVWGIITSTATFMAIPFAFLWGYLCDATQKYRFFILMSFAIVTVLLYLLSLTTNLFILSLLYTLIAIFDIAHDPPKNVLIAETYSHLEWKDAYARYGAWTEIGWFIGLLLGFLLSSLGLQNATILLFSVFLSFISFLASTIFVLDPALIFERGLVSMEKSISVIDRGSALLSKAEAGVNVMNELRQENTLALCFGLVLFDLAASMFFTPLPIFFAQNLALQTSTIFILFLISSSSCATGYFLSRRETNSEGAKSIKKIALFRSLIVLFAIAALVSPLSMAFAISVVILSVMGLAAAFYSVSVLLVSMEVIPQGRAGLFTALVGSGSAIGCLMGPLIAQNFGFQYTFLISATCFLLSYVAFKKFA